MSRITKQQRVYLESKSGKHVTFDKMQLKLYGHDIAALPKLIKPLIGDTTPDAVVQPQTEEELDELIRWAMENRIPLPPRGVVIRVHKLSQLVWRSDCE